MNIVRGIKTICLFIIMLIGNKTFAETNKQSIELITGLDKAPFIFNDATKGVQIELIRQAFAINDVDVKFTPLPLGRNITGYQRWNVQGIITLPSDYSYPGMSVSKPYIIYQNVAVSLARNNFAIKDVADLSGKSVASFQKAKKFLGSKFKEVVNYSLDYREVADQRKQLEMLFAGQTEVIVLDINIFKYFMRNQAQALYRKPYTLHYIFKERAYSAGFKSEQYRDMFDLAILDLKQSGDYNRLFEKYLLNSRPEK